MNINTKIQYFAGFDNCDANPGYRVSGDHRRSWPDPLLGAQHDADHPEHAAVNPGNNIASKDGSPGYLLSIWQLLRKQK